MFLGIIIGFHRNHIALLDVNCFEAHCHVTDHPSHSSTGGLRKNIFSFVYSPRVTNYLTIEFEDHILTAIWMRNIEHIGQMFWTHLPCICPRTAMTFPSSLTTVSPCRDHCFLFSGGLTNTPHRNEFVPTKPVSQVPTY